MESVTLSLDYVIVKKVSKVEIAQKKLAAKMTTIVEPILKELVTLNLEFVNVFNHIMEKIVNSKNYLHVMLMIFQNLVIMLELVVKKENVPVMKATQAKNVNSLMMKKTH